LRNKIQAFKKEIIFFYFCLQWNDSVSMGKKNILKETKLYSENCDSLAVFLNWFHKAENSNALAPRPEPTHWVICRPRGNRSFWCHENNISARNSGS